jgi:hypothetical protein
MDCEQAWCGNACRRIYPAYRTLVQIAANGGYPPFMSKCAWRSISCYQLLMSIDMNGP